MQSKIFLSNFPVGGHKTHFLNIHTPLLYNPWEFWDSVTDSLKPFILCLLTFCIAS